MTVSTETRSQIGTRKRHGRAVNAVADFLRYRFPKLSVPNIYLEPQIPSQPGIDVLAIDRAGSGDLYAIEIKEPEAIRSSAQFNRYLEQLKKWPAHFRYIAISKRLQPEQFIAQPKLFAPNGIGRIGILLLEEHELDPLQVELFSPAERFPVDVKTIEKIEKSLSDAKKRPDIEVRI